MSPKRNRSSTHDVYDVIDRFKGTFTVWDVHEAMPWMRKTLISSALGRLRDIGVLQLVAHQDNPAGRTVNVYVVKDLKAGAAVRWASAHQEGLHRNYKGKRAPARPKVPKEPTPTSSSSVKSKLEDIAMRLIDIAAELEELGL